jgi:hypothetical protein
LHAQPAPWLNLVSRTSSRIATEDTLATMRTALLGHVEG